MYLIIRRNEDEGNALQAYGKTGLTWYLRNGQGSGQIPSFPGFLSMHWNDMVFDTSKEAQTVFWTHDLWSSGYRIFYLPYEDANEWRKVEPDDATAIRTELEQIDFTLSNIKKAVITIE